MGQRLSANTQKSVQQKPASALVNEKDRAMLDLKRARDKLRKFRVKLDKDCDNLSSRARELVQSGKNDKALFVLKLRKFKVNEAENVEGQLTRVLTMIETINWEEQNKVVLQALQSGTQALNKMHDEMPLDLVESILEDNEEALQRQESISEAFQTSLDDADNAELESELAALEKEFSGGATITGSVEAELPSVPSSKPVPSLPDVPTDEPVPVVRQQEQPTRVLA